MSAIDNTEVASAEKSEDIQLSDIIKSSDGFENYEIRKPKRVLHFSDGTLEEYDDDDSDDDIMHPHFGGSDGVDKPFQKASAESRMTNSEPPVNPKTLNWGAWIKHYTMMGGTKTIDFLDNLGEGLTYYLGITTPKYNYEIEEYKRMQEEQKAANKAKAEETATWATAPNSANPDPITSDVKIQTEILSGIDIEKC